MSNLDKMPTSLHYAQFVAEASRMLNKTKEEIRNLYGRYTYRQWYELLILNDPEL